jgi:hypothetical protein
MKSVNGKLALLRSSIYICPMSLRTRLMTEFAGGRHAGQAARIEEGTDG